MRFTKTRYNALLGLTVGLLILAALILGFLNTRLHARVKAVDLIGSTSQAVTVDQRVSIHFSQPMDRNSVSAALQVSPSTKFDLGWGINSLLVSFRDNLEADTKYTLTIADSAQDIYGTKLNSNFEFEFTTKLPTFVYAERNYLINQQPDKIVRTTISSQAETLFTGNDIEHFALNPNYLVVSQLTADKYSSLKLLDLSSRATSEIPLQNKQLTKVIFSPKRDEFVYVAQDVNVSDGVPIPTSGNRVYLYRIATRATEQINPQMTAEDVADLTFAPDGNALLYRGEDGTYYITDINSPTTLVMIGKHFATGGFNHTSDHIVFVDYDPLGTNGGEYPYINILNTNRDTISLTAGENFVVDPDFFHNSDKLVISEKYAELEGTKGLFQIVVLDATGKHESDFRVDSQSLELPKISQDDRYVLAEQYGNDELTNYQNMRSFVFQTKPYSAKLRIYDLQEKKFLDQTWNGVDGVWER